MKLNPQQAPLYGKCLITVQLCDEELVEDEEGVEFFLLFAGTTQSHLTSTLKSSHGTLQALCPAHDCCEAVRVTLCSARPMVPTAPADIAVPREPVACPALVAQVAEQRFTFVQDLAFDMAQFLVSTAGRTDGLEGAMLLDECQIPLQECERLDESLALALHHLTLPPGWSLLGKKLTNSTEPEPQETLLHFAARRGLRRVAGFLLLQSGAREALRLANKQGHTPAGVAELRGHRQLHQLLTQAEANTETSRGTEALHVLPVDARVVCHLPRLNTHTLTVGTSTGRDTPSLQRTVEQLRHLICHLHAKGVVSLDLQPESLHTAQECCDGVESHGACLEQLQQQSDGLDTGSQGCVKENKAEDNSNSSAGEGCEAGNRGRDRGTSLTPPTSERPLDNGLGPTEDRVCLGPNANRDYFETEEQRREEGEQQEEEKEEGREAAALADQDLSVCDRSDGAQNQAEGESLAPGAPPPPSCGKDTQETDIGEAVICEAQGAREGTDKAEQEGEESTSGREEEKNSESRYPATHSGETTISNMGHTQSLENSEASESSDSGMKCYQEAENVQEEGEEEEEEVESKQDLCDSLFLNEEKPGTEGLTDPISTTGDLPYPSLIESGDVIQEVTSSSVGPCAVIEGLCEGEPPPDINSLEQNQETAVTDYSTEKQCDCADASSHLAPETGRHSGDCSEIGHAKVDTGTASEADEDFSLSVDLGEKSTVPLPLTGSSRLPLNEPNNLEETTVENTADIKTAGHSNEVTMGNTVMDLNNCEASPERMANSGNGQTELDAGMAQGLSSDEEGSFQSFSSSTTEIFHPAEETDGTNMDDQDLIRTKMVELGFNGITISGQNDAEPNENNKPSSSDALTATDSGQASLTSLGIEPESQPSPGIDTMEAFSLEKAEETTPEHSVEWPSLEQGSAEIEDTQMVDNTERQCDTIMNNGSDLNLETEEGRLGSEVTESVLDPQDSEPTLAEKREAPTLVDRFSQPTETSITSEVASGEESGEIDLQSGIQRLSEGSSESQPAAEEDIQLPVSSTEDVTPSLEMFTRTADDSPEDAVPPSPEDVASSEPPAEEVSSPKEEMEPSKTFDVADKASECTSEALSCHASPVKETDESLSEEDMVDGQEEPTQEDTSTIHREKEAAYPLPLSPCPQADTSHSRLCTVSSQSLSSSACPTVSSTPSTAHRDSGSDTESFFSTDTGEDCVFRKGDERVTGGDSTSEVSISCSSTDDTASVGPVSSSPESCLEGQGLGRSWSLEEGSQTGAAVSRGVGCGGGGGGGGGGGETEEEAKDRLTEVPRRSSILRPGIRSLSPFRRHSWGPGKNGEGESEMNQRSSIRSPGEGKPTFHRRSMSWCPPEAPLSPGLDVVSCLSYSLEGLSREREEAKGPSSQGPGQQEPQRDVRQESEERGSLVSLTEERECKLGEHGKLEEQKSRRYRPLRHSCPPLTLPLTKSVSMLAISQRDIDAMGHLRRKRRISFSFSLSPILTKSKSQFVHVDSSSSDDEDVLSMRSFSSASGSLAYSISEEEPGPLRSDSEGKSGTKVSRTFSYLKSKMYKKTREKEREKKGDKDKEAKERDKRTPNGHLFTTVSSAHAALCNQCNKAINTKEAFHCTHCNAYVHKGCRESLSVCAKVKMKFPKQQITVTDSNSIPAVTMRNKSAGTRDRPWSAILSPDDHSSMVLPLPRRHTSIMPFHSSNLSKSISISNIAGPVFDDMPIKGLRYLSQSTDSLNRTNQVNESTESLTDEGTEMMDSQLMGEFEGEVKELEADSWSFSVDKKYLKQLKKDVIKRQDVIYELIQTEMHHVRTLRIMSEVYSKGLQKEVQLEAQTVERMFPALDELLELHTQHFLRLLERKKESQQEASDGGFAISRIGDILVSQFSGSNAESMKRVYGKFCSRHNEAVNFYKEFLTKDKRFQAFIKKKMSSSIVRRLGIPECILLVTQRITKYPVLMQRILQHTKENEEDHEDLAEALRLVKEVIAAVDSKVNEHEKKRRLKDIYSRTDSKSIMRMKSGQMFAREDLIRGRKLLHDGPLQLKNAQGRLKDVQALLLSDVFVFLQEKDQKYIFAALDQRSTVISLQKLIVREVANEERGLFLITASIEKPEMVEVLASTKDERNTWMQLIQDAMHSIDKDEDEGIPSETEEDKRQLETKAKEMRDILRKKDEQIVALLEEKMKVFRDMYECVSPGGEQASSPAKALFRAASSQDLAKGEPIMKDALQEVETLQALVNGSLGGAMAVGQQVASVQEAGVGGGGGGVGPICLPRRAETFGGFDSHQMNSSKSDKDECEDLAGDLRRTESDSVLKKGGNANLLLLLKRNSEKVLHSVTHLHDLLNALQAVVVQQDSFIEDQRQALSERSSSTTSSASSSRASSRPNSLIEQEKQRSLEKHRQEMASLQRQQAAHAEEKRRREKEWELREQQLTDREVLLHVQEEEAGKRHKELEEERQELQSKKEEYQRDLERLRDAQRKLERDREMVHREMERIEQLRLAEKRMERTPSSTSEDSLLFTSTMSLERDPQPGELELSSSPKKDSLSRQEAREAKPKGKSLNPFASVNTSLKGIDSHNQIPNRLLQLAKNKDKKDKKKKKGKGGSAQSTDPQHLPEPPLDGEIFFC